MKNKKNIYKGIKCDTCGHSIMVHYVSLETGMEHCNGDDGNCCCAKFVSNEIK